MLGGMIIPVTPAAATVAAVYCGRYPFSRIGSFITPPMAATVAALDPDNAAKKLEARIATAPSPPVKCPTSDAAKFTSRRDMPPSDMISPARMKNGTARSGKELLVENIRWTTISRLISLTTSPTTLASPSATAIGARSSMRPIRTPKITAAVMSGASRRRVVSLAVLPERGGRSEKLAQQQFDRVDREESHARRRRRVDP